MKFEFLTFAAIFLPSAAMAVPPHFGAEELLPTIARADAESAKTRARALHTTLVAMNDGPQASEKVTEFLKARGVSVYTAEQAEPSRYAAGSNPAIVLSSRLPAHPRVYAPFIAYEAAKLMYADMPASAEREYMIMATAARVFLELGGEFSSLPVVDGDKVPELRDLVSAWAGNVEAAIDSFAGKNDVPTLQVVRERDPQAGARAYDRFVDFRFDETYARRALKP